MERYDYHEAVYNDVVDYIRENINFADYDTIEDLADHLNDNGEAIIQGAETCDVIIRCYLLPSAISEALEDMEDEFDAAHGGECDDE